MWIIIECFAPLRFLTGLFPKTFKDFVCPEAVFGNARTDVVSKSRELDTVEHLCRNSMFFGLKQPRQYDFILRIFLHPSFWKDSVKS